MSVKINRKDAKRKIVKILRLVDLQGWERGSSEAAVGISYRQITKYFRSCEENNNNKAWIDTNGCEQPFFKEPNRIVEGRLRRWTTEINYVSPVRPVTRTVNRLCEENKETTTPILCECEALLNMRRRFVGTDFIEKSSFISRGYPIAATIFEESNRLVFDKSRGIKME